VKRMSKSISGSCETDVDIHFVIFFFLVFCVPRMSTSGSGNSTIDVDIRFSLFFGFLCTVVIHS